MTDYRARPSSGTVGARVWRIVAAHGPIGAAEVARIAGITRKSATSALYRLNRRGRVSLTGIAAQARFTALGKYPPRDRRGKPAGSRNHSYANVIAMCTARCGPAWRPPIRPAIELERVWPAQRRA